MLLSMVGLQPGGGDEQGNTPLHAAVDPEAGAMLGGPTRSRTNEEEGQVVALCRLLLARMPGELQAVPPYVCSQGCIARVHHT